MQNPPPLVLTEAVHITAEAPPGMPIIPAITTAIPGSGMFNSPNATRANAHEFNTHTQKVTDEFRIRTAQLPGLIEQELAATRLEGATHPLPPSAAIIRELGVRQLLISRKTAEYQQKTTLANQFFGENPLNKNFHDYYMKVSHSRRSYLLGIANPWVVSYRAAHEAQLLSQSIQILNQQQVDVHKWLAAVQGNDQAQAAAAETRRQEAERARIAAEQQRQRALAEQARREREEIRVREQERLAKLAEARRLAEVQARTAAEAAARQVRTEQSRLEELADKHRQAEAEQLRIERAYRAQEEQREHQREKALRAEQSVIRQQAAKNRRERLLQAELEAQERRRAQTALDAEAEPARQAELARQKIKWRMQTEARWEKPEFANVGSAINSGPTFSGTLGDIATDRVTSLALTNALRTGITTAISTASAFAAPVLIGFAALLVPSELGNGDLFSASVPLSDLAPDLKADLHQLAATGGHLDLPVRLGPER